MRTRRQNNQLELALEPVARSKPITTAHSNSGVWPSTNPILGPIGEVVVQH